MARRGNSVFGIDLGKHVFKGVLLERKGDDLHVTLPITFARTVGAME